MLHVLSMLFKNCKKNFHLLTETTGEILQTNLRSYTLKMSHWYQMNLKVFLNNNALSTQRTFMAGLSLSFFKIKIE